MWAVILAVVRIGCDRLHQFKNKDRDEKISGNFSAVIDFLYLPE